MNGTRKQGIPKILREREAYGKRYREEQPEGVMAQSYFEQLSDIVESEDSLRLAYEAAAKKIFEEIEDWTFNVAEDREKEILISDTGKYKALKKEFGFY